MSRDITTCSPGVKSPLTQLQCCTHSPAPVTTMCVCVCVSVCVCVTLCVTKPFHRCLPSLSDLPPEHQTLQSSFIIPLGDVQSPGVEVRHSALLTHLLP